jgi:ketosteroid isomerase-like protein
VTDSPNVDLVRSLYVAWERGDYFSSVDWAHPEIELVTGMGGPDPRSWSGLAAVGRGWREFLRDWTDWHIEIEEYRELGDDRVLALGQLHGCGRRSTVQAEQLAASAANLFHICDGKIKKVVLYWDRERAFADLGLAPEGES